MGQIVMNTGRYAPIDRFEILQEPVPSGIVRGLASPASGPKPCALALVADGTTIATAAATAFSADAQQRGVRLGWCAFEIGGLRQALALGQEVELRCVASGQVQARWDGDYLTAGLKPQHAQSLMVEDMLRGLRDDGACTDVQWVVPFGLEVARNEGSHGFLRGTYRYFLRRLPEQSAVAEFTGDYTSPEAVLGFWQMIMRSTEFNLAGRTSVPGPFDAFFPFPLDPLDG